MKLNVTQTLTELDGTPLKTSAQICVACRRPIDTGEVMTLRLALTRALSFRGQNEQLEYDIQRERYKLAKRIQANDEVELDVAERDLLQKLVAAINHPPITGQVGELLEGE